MTLTLNKGFWSPAAGGGNNPPFDEVTGLINFDASPMAAIVGGAIGGRTNRDTSVTVFSSAGASQFVGDSDSGQSNAYAVNYVEFTSKTAGNALGEFGSDPFMVELNYYPQDNTGYYTEGILLNLGYLSPSNGLAIEFTSADKIELQCPAAGVGTLLSDTASTLNTWHYLNVAGSGLDGGSGTISVYHAPITESSTPRRAQTSYTSYNSGTSSSMKTSIGALYHSSRPLGGFYYSYYGYVDNLRITKGTDLTSQASSIDMISAQFPTS